MFECSWNDPGSETVGQRKNRKETIHISSAPSSSNGSRRDEGAGSVRSGSTSNSNESQLKMSIKHIFSTKKNKEATKKQDMQISGLSTSNPGKPQNLRSIPTHAMNSILSQFPTPPLSPASLDNQGRSTQSFDYDTTNPSSVSGSIFSERPARSGTFSTWNSALESPRSAKFHSIMEATSPASFIEPSMEMPISHGQNLRAKEQNTTFAYYSAVESPIMPKFPVFPVSPVSSKFVEETSPISVRAPSIDMTISRRHSLKARQQVETPVQYPNSNRASLDGSLNQRTRFFARLSNPASNSRNTPSPTATIIQRYSLEEHPGQVRPAERGADKFPNSKRASLDGSLEQRTTFLARPLNPASNSDSAPSPTVTVFRRYSLEEHPAHEGPTNSNTDDLSNADRAATNAVINSPKGKYTIFPKPLDLTSKAVTTPRPIATSLQALRLRERAATGTTAEESMDVMLASDELPVLSPWTSQAPDDWELSPRLAEPPMTFKRLVSTTPDISAESMNSRHSSKRSNKTISIQMAQLQSTVRKIEAASDKIMLERLKEEWTGVADSSLYRELEIEKQQWLRMALRRRPILGSSEVSKPSKERLLSLYENEASCSLLSALNESCKIYHVSVSPLSRRYWPNVRPVKVAEVRDELRFESKVFAAIHACSLPARVPASAIPAILKECHRTLVSERLPMSPAVNQPFPSLASSTSLISKAGVLHLTILDPTPILSTLGPRLRTWITDHLISTLERQSRCTSPARLFPILLQDANLRALGSTISPVKFFACCPSSKEKIQVADLGINSNSVSGLEGRRTKLELRSLVGRLLWKEMWGPYVEAACWWWEDEDIVEECEQMKTYWEYFIIEAVKEG